MRLNKNMRLKKIGAAKLWPIPSWGGTPTVACSLAVAIFIVQCTVLCASSYAYLSTPEIEALTQKIIMAESSGRWGVVGDGGKSSGLFQIIKPTWEALSYYPWSDALDHEKNYQVGAKLIHEIHENYGKEATAAKIAYTFNVGRYIKKGQKLPKWTKHHPNAIYRSIFNAEAV